MDFEQTLLCKAPDESLNFCCSPCQDLYFKLPIILCLCTRGNKINYCKNENLVFLCKCLESQLPAAIKAFLLKSSLSDENSKKKLSKNI